MLLDEELQWVNDYHVEVRKNVAPVLHKQVLNLHYLCRADRCALLGNYFHHSLLIGQGNARSACCKCNICFIPPYGFFVNVQTQGLAWAAEWLEAATQPLEKPA
jgi:hypothetical protein